MLKVNSLCIPAVRVGVLVVVYALMRVIFIAFNVDLFPTLTAGQLPKIFLGGLKYDLAAIAYINLPYLALYYLAFEKREHPAYKKFLNVFFYTTNAIGFLANCADTLYYKYTLKRTTWNVLNEFGGNNNMLRLFAGFIVDYWYMVLIFAAFVALFVFACKRFVGVATKHWRIVKTIEAFVLAIAMAVGAIRGSYSYHRALSLQEASNFVGASEQTAIVLNTPFSIIRTTGKEPLPDFDFFATEEELTAAYNPVHLPTDTAAFQAKNVVVIILEGFAREFVGACDSTVVSYTPFLDSLSANGYLCRNAYACGRKSIFAMPAVLAGVPSLKVAYVLSEYVNNEINGLPQMLRNKGYQTAFFHGADNGSMGFDAFAVRLGFEKYHGMNEYANDDDFDGNWGIWDHLFLNYFCNEMNKMQQPFMTTVFTVTSHPPFNIPDDFKEIIPEGKIKRHRAVRYSDYALKMFFDQARQQEWFNNTLFVLVADHSVPGYEESYKNNKGIFAIPILFYAPADSTLRGVDDRVVQQSDIMPSVLDYLNYDKPFIAFGSSIFSGEADRFAAMYYGEHQFIIGDSILQFPNDTTTLTKAYLQQYYSRLKTNRLTAK